MAASSHPMSELPWLGMSSSKRSTGSIVAHPPGKLCCPAKRIADSLNKKMPPGTPLCLTHDPKACSVACNEEEWDRIADQVGIGPPRKFGPCVARWDRPTLIGSRLIGAYNRANALQRRSAEMIDMKMCALASHHQLRVPATGESPRPVVPGRCTSRRQRASSWRERRNVIAGTARLLRFTTYASSACARRCQNPTGCAAPVLTEGD